jgi:hypothetical protein
MRQGGRVTISTNNHQINVNSVILYFKPNTDNTIKDLADQYKEIANKPLKLDLKQGNLHLRADMPLSIFIKNNAIRPL